MHVQGNVVKNTGKCQKPTQKMISKTVGGINMWLITMWL